MEIKERITKALTILSASVAFTAFINKLADNKFFSLDLWIAVGMGLMMCLLMEAMTGTPLLWRYIFNWGLENDR